MSNAASKRAKVAPRTAGASSDVFGRATLPDPGSWRWITARHSRHHQLNSTPPKCPALACADEELKWLSWPEYLQLCGELRRECAGLDVNGRRRKPAAVAWSLQVPAGRGGAGWSMLRGQQALQWFAAAGPRGCCSLRVPSLHLGGWRPHSPRTPHTPHTPPQRYLIFAIFSCVPDRQASLGCACGELGACMHRGLDCRGRHPFLTAARPPPRCTPCLQRTLRELEFGRTLVKDREGRWIIRHGPADYKVRWGGRTLAAQHASCPAHAVLGHRCTTHTHQCALARCCVLPCADGARVRRAPAAGAEPAHLSGAGSVHGALARGAEPRTQPAVHAVRAPAALHGAAHLAASTWGCHSCSAGPA